ncbi:MAG: DUF1800 domain-containing protein [Candidatus Sumerlaeaceae bacterium]
MAYLDPYTGPWTTKEAAHLARRAGFGATPAELATMVSAGMSGAVDARVNYSPTDTTLDAQITALPATTDNNQIKAPIQSAHLEGWWIYRMVHSTQPLQQQFALFMHDTLCSEYGKVSNNVSNASDDGNDGSQAGQACLVSSGGLAPDIDRQRKIILRLLKDQNTIFTTQGHLGYVNLLKTITRDPAMLIYLDNRLNIKGKAQENYAREVMELFSMGVGNYTETDVREIARAFTGETVRTSCSLNWPYDYSYDATKHDTNSKTVFGVTFNNAAAGADTNQVIDLIANTISNSGITPAHQVLPATSIHMSWKFITWFVSESIPISHDAVVELATFFYNNTSPNGYPYDVRETLRKLFKSQFFYDNAYYYRMYKHPPDYMVSALRNLGIDDTNYTGSAYSRLRSMGMRLFQPPNVAGWNHGRAWINSGNLVARFNYADRISTSTFMTDAYVDNLITSGAVTNTNDNTGILNYLSQRLLQDSLTVAETAPFTTFFNGITTGTATQSQYRRKVRGAAHLMMTMPRYQLK